MQTRTSPDRETLLRLAHRVGVAAPNRLSKTQLFNRLKSEYNFERLLRQEVRRSFAHSSARKRGRDEGVEVVNPRSTRSSPPQESSSKGPLNALDPIMMIPISKKKSFKFFRPNGTAIQFNVDSLVDYLLASGDFHEPETRLPFSDSDLREIDRLAAALGMDKPSVFEARYNPKLFSEAKFRRDALLALERCAGEVVAEMLEIAETFEYDDAQCELAMREFPVFADYYRQMKQADPEYASKCIAQWKQFIAGPPNKPNDDEFGLIRCIGVFLRSCESDC